MALNTERWLPETNLRLVNFGDAPLELHWYVKAQPEVTGKKIPLPPHSEQFIQVKELLPPGAQISDLGANKVLFSISNKGTGQGHFNVFEDGPFRSEAAALTYPNDMERIAAIYQEMISHNDYYQMRKVLEKPVPDAWKVNNSFYGGMQFLRGKMAGSLLRIDEADAAFEAGYEPFNNDQKWFFCFDWAVAMQHTLTLPAATPAQKGKALQKAIQVLGMAKQHSRGLRYEKEMLLGAACLHAFLLCYIGEGDEAQALFNDMEFTPLAPDAYGQEDINTFFSLLPYGFWAAIELKDGDLLRNLCRPISTGHPDMLREASPVLCMRRAFGNLFEKGVRLGNIAQENLMNTGHHYAPEMPHLREFLVHLAKKDEEAINRFIPYIDWNLDE